eukprot:35181-Eustigmatos_ZCMA.PRE.1
MASGYFGHWTSTKAPPCKRSHAILLHATWEECSNAWGVVAALTPNAKYLPILRVSKHLMSL